MECSGYVSPTMVGRQKIFLKPRPLKVRFTVVNFWKKLVEKANFYGKNYWNSLISAKIMVQSKFRANYQAWTVQLIIIIWKIKGCSEKKFTEENYWDARAPRPPVPTALINHSQLSDESLVHWPSCLKTLACF